MPSFLLFGINNEGRVHSLSTNGTMWREVPYMGQEFKKLSAVPHFLWAIGGDHQVYVYVHGLDIPIRVKEECYENERWIPIEGFSSRLLPTDRFKYSSADGTVDRSRDKMRLPSMAWQWEGEWKLELSLNGQPLDHNGWTYAVDFPATYHAKKQWSSCVRRRLWVRSRRYAALNSWCAIAPLHKDATTEPFIDIAVGGQNISGAEQGTMVVWAVTSHNRVMFRKGVSTKSPEGAKWIHISVPVGSEVSQLSVGPTGLLWATLLDGRALVRTGVTRDALSGDNWIEVRAPGQDLRISHLAVGISSVWAVTHDKQIFFRRGVKGEGAGLSEEMAAGDGWVEMVGRMTMVSVTANDQVFAVSADDRAVYYRMGITNGDLTGKRWRCLHAPMQVSRASSSASLSRDKFQNRSNTSLNSRPHSLCETSGISEWEESSHSAPNAPTSLPVGELSGSKHFETQLKNPKAWSPVRSVGSVVGTEVISDESVYQSERQDSCIFAEDEELGWADYETPWKWVESGACWVDANQLPNWFAETASMQSLELQQPWRIQILTDLKARLPEKDKFSDYANAIDATSWIYNGDARVAMLGNGVFVDCVLQLEWMQTTGTLTILHPDGVSTMHQFSMNEVTCVQCCSEPGNPRLIMHTPKIIPPFIKLQFTSDTVMEEWQTHFVTVSLQLQSCSLRPANNSIWAITNLGDIFNWDSNQQLSSQLNDDGFYEQTWDLYGKELPISLPLHTNLAPGSIIRVNGCVGDTCDRFSLNLVAQKTYKQRHKAHAEYENIVLHFNPRFNDNLIVRTSMIEGNWLPEERGNGGSQISNLLAQGHEFRLKILVRHEDLLIFINGREFCSYRHRIPCSAATVFDAKGKVKLFKFSLSTPERILDPRELYFRQFGGHMRKVESCPSGVTWGIGYDQTAWVYNGGWGGGFLGTMDSNSVNPMADTQYYKVYENQRWNPMSGYTSTGLPTDRHMWSDSTGRQKRTKDQVKLLSMHWQWISDWLVDFQCPGGVDKEGWQYAVDFPSTYHGNKHFTDCVRRRRWYRCCAINTSGPWQELGHTKLIDVSLQEVDGDVVDSPIVVWALAWAGQPMVRIGVSSSNPTGSKWEHVTSDQSFTSISCGPFDKVWATGKNGCAYWRSGITEENLLGEKWHCVEPPPGAQLTQISIGPIGVWAVDSNGRIQLRKEIVDNIPEGTHWHCVSIDPPLLNSSPNTTSFKQVSAGRKDLWAVTDGGVMAKREGISKENPIGTGWDLGISGNWKHVCVKAFS